MNKKCKILHIFSAFISGGMETSFLNFLSNVDYNKYEHYIFVINDRGPLRKYFHRLPVKIIKMKWGPKRYFYNLPYGYLFCKKNKISIIHGHNFESCLYGYFLSILTNIPLFTSSYSPGLGSWAKKRSEFLESLILRKARINISVSKEIMEEEIAVTNNGRVYPDKFKLVYPISKDISLESLFKYDKTMLRKKFKINNDKPVLTIIGRLIKVKGHRIAIEAVDRINQDGLKVNLLIAGKKDDPSIIKREDLEKDYIKYFDFVDNLEEIWALTDVFLITSFSEGTPVVLLEYFAIGKPVIASSIYGNKELISEGENGFLFQPGNVDELVEKIKYVNEYENLPAIKTNAQRLYFNDLSPKKLTQKIESYYSENT